MGIDLGRPKPRLDWLGRYLVVPPEGGKPIGYTRSTTISKALEDQSALINWRSRMTAIGLAQRPDLLALVGTSADDKKKLDDLCDRAAEHGGATARRDLGTALHAMFEQSIVQPGYSAPAEYAADIAAIHQVLEQAGLTIVAGMVERQVVLDDIKVAGTFDMLLEDHNGKRYIGDLKTGASLDYSAQGFALQLAIYAHADALYSQGPAKDGSEDAREPMPTVDQDRAVIVHCQPGSGTATVHALDIAVGWEKVQTALEVRAWRYRKDVLIPWGAEVIWTGEAGAVLEVPNRQWIATVDPVDNATRARSLRARAKEALALWPNGVDEFRRCWPEHVPPLTDETHVWKRRELDDLEELIVGAENRLIPLPACYGEGRIVEQAEADQVRDLHTALPAPARVVLEQIGREALAVTLWPTIPDTQDDRYPLREQSMWRAMLLVTVASLFDTTDIDPVLRACARHIYGDVTVTNLCRALLSLTADDCVRLVDRIETGHVRFDTAADGDTLVTLD